MKLRQARWLEKLLLMNCSRGPQQILSSWLFDSPKSAGGQQQTIKHTLSKTLTNSLGFENDNLND